MKKSKKLLVFMLMMAFMMSFVLAGCGGGTATPPAATDQSSTPAAGDKIIIGVFEPLTGGNAAGGEMTVEGIELAHQLFPEILGMPVELKIADNKSEQAEAANAVQRLIDKENANIIIGSYGSSVSMAAGPIAADKQICVIGCSPTNPAVTLGNDYYFRVCFIDPFQGTVMANYAMNTLGAKTAAIIQDVQNDYSVGLANYFVKAFKAVNGEDSIVSTVNYNTGDKDFSAQLTEVKSKNPDIIFAPGSFMECGMLIDKARSMGMMMPVLGGDTWEAKEFLDQVASYSDIYFSTHFTAEEPVTAMSTTFMDEFKKAYPDKEINAFGALGFDTYLLAKDAIEKAGSLDKEAIRAALAGTTDFEGATGIITLDENGDATKTAVIKQVKDGAFVYVDKVDPK